MSGNRAGAIGELIRRHGWNCGAELGVKRGRTLFRLLDEHPQLSMIGVDVWSPMYEHPDKDYDTGEMWHGCAACQEALYQQVLVRSAEYGYRCKIMRATTRDAHEHVLDFTLDFVFIDADHRTESVLEDIDNWSPKVRFGGYLIGDDLTWPSVQRALEQSGLEWHALRRNIWAAKI